MARNQEKAQSMLYRFREAQAAELGLSSNKQQRRPRLASSVSSLRECEKWRGDILREISRKVSKIQDFGLTDFEVRDLNDEINKLLREKNHWENQIIALGGANYKRGVPKMLDDGGREVPGTRGYKYFGRAKDLPGVKELFERTPQQEAEAESFRSRKYQRFNHLPPEYYGDLDEDDGVVLEFEQAEEEKEWKEGYARVLESLGMDTDDAEIPGIPRPTPKSLKEIRERHGAMPSSSSSSSAAASAAAAAAAAATATETQPAKRGTSFSATSGGKRQKATDGSAVAVDAANGDEGEDTEMTDAAQPDDAGAAAAAAAAEEATRQSENFKTLYYSVLDAQELEMPRVPDRAATEKMILAAKKKALRDECE
ncbi:related to Pre-mRNA-splicing factor ISY1 [Pseudozyma flocculosa]|uniref:Related to Pre-mRNA-splicing factor ISY1 n=1 Tax=Pseudozyma flocculosa TaxID=84751 RepID=A0A5C3EU47_9BASI|nr:related to Pre-mRNA-splicing factor ISY1 [Pseudozyma flocculosa]